MKFEDFKAGQQVVYGNSRGVVIGRFSDFVAIQWQHMAHAYPPDSANLQEIQEVKINKSHPLTKIFA